MDCKIVGTVDFLIVNLWIVLDGVLIATAQLLRGINPSKTGETFTCLYFIVFFVFFFWFFRLFCFLHHLLLLLSSLYLCA